MRVNNVNGTSGNTCACGSWLDHWRKFSGGAGLLCVVYNCRQRAFVGAHIQRDNPFDRSWYIIPLCQTHNADTGKSLTVPDDTALVRANVSETCGKAAKAGR